MPRTHDHAVIQKFNNYFTRYLVAEAVPQATYANSVEFVDRKIVRPFGWPRAFYHDNGSHFKKHLSAKLIEMKVKQYFAAISHPSSVGLAERYVQLVEKVFRAILQHHLDAIFEWDLLLPAVMNAINTRMIRAFGFTPAELLLGFLPRYVANAGSYEDFLRTKVVEDKMKTFLAENMPDAEALTIEERHFEERLAKIDAIRDLALDRRIEMRENLAERTEKDKPSPKIRDLLRLRRHYQDNTHTGKLLRRFEGPYRVAKLAANGKSVFLEDLNGGTIKGRYHNNDTIPFRERTKFVLNTQS